MRKEWRRIRSGSLTIATLFKRAVESGWKPRCDYSGGAVAETPLRAGVIEPPPPDLRPIVDAAVAATPGDWLDRLARSLSLPASTGAEALRRLGAHRARYDADDILRLAPRDPDDVRSLRRFVAWIARGDVAGFPMSVRGRVVGVRLRDTRTARKLALRGGKEGVFVPTALASGLDVLVVVEGPTDLAALLAVGIEAIGRPNCTGGVDECLRLALVLKPHRVAVVLDRDEPGIKGGAALARALANIVADVRCALPPAGTKDVRAWVAAGATRDDLLAKIDGGRRV